MKKLILVTSPPACGKTYVSKQIAKNLNHIVYLDKDTLIPLSKQIFKVANEEYNRSSEFFERNIRDFEYEAIVEIALEALEYDDKVLINAPFTSEVRNINYMNNLKEKLKAYNARLVIIWVQTEIGICKERMIKRNSERDVWKLKNWDKYIKGVDFSIPTALDDPNINDDLLIFDNSTELNFQNSMSEIIGILEE